MLWRLCYKRVRWRRAAIFLTSGAAVGRIDYADGGDFTEVDWQKLVETRQITPMLLAEMNTEQPAKPTSSSRLQQELANYDYVVGRGDILNITVWDHPELTIPAGSMRALAEAGNWHNDGTIFTPTSAKSKSPVCG